MLRVAIVFIQDATGRVFVHRRRDDKRVFPGLLGFGVGGRIEVGESARQGAARELREEAGLATPLEAVTRFRYPNPSGACQVNVFQTHYSGAIANHDAEWSWSGWWEPREAERAIEAGQVCPDTCMGWAALKELGDAR